MENIAKQEPDYRNLYELSELNLENLRRQLEQKTTWCLLLEKTAGDAGNGNHGDQLKNGRTAKGNQAVCQKEIK